MSSAICVGIAALALLCTTRAANGKPNILMIMTDDQDYRLGSLEYMDTVQKEIVGKGTLFDKHFVTTAQCCPSRAALLRGQQTHNTNITHVMNPGMLDTELSKLLNGIDILNYNPAPKGWDNVDVLLDPYAYSFNTVVMSKNGETPVYYEGYHQSDVIRAKVMSTLEDLTSGDEPWFYMVAPTAPHTEGIDPPVPLTRHKNDFADLIAPRSPNFNPQTQQKPSWVGALPTLNSTLVDLADTAYRARIRSLQGIDEMVHDILQYLDSKGELENTYVIYTADNGYHVGNHRALAGKGLPYIEDTNVPFIVRGPGVPANRISKTATTHIDLAPTFLDIAGVLLSSRPELFDGRSLLPDWTSSSNTTSEGNVKVDKEILNVEFWGPTGIEVLPDPSLIFNNTYKTMRIVGEEYAYLYSRWCTGETEFYDTKEDPYELTNLALDPKDEDQKVMDRLNALLLVTKSCEQDLCRDPWSVLMQNSTLPGVCSLKEAMNALYNDFFAGFPLVSFKECGQVYENGTYDMGLIQMVENELPFYPPGAENGLGQAHRKSTDNYWPVEEGDCDYKSITNTEHCGSWAQRSATLEVIEKSARILTNEELPDPNMCNMLPELTA
ncbi:alkaline phosphatase-like protein [Zopfia rhizophila CBS 207.26]|uniref:Alkaline phosphatase-like protein n=1 Tax=Zopfia rhizophila CBS 207.26 TaxID=1314779 RepID=A0A6A6DPL0_9PEZI|nr:alkaline phosphatase-like protein [Zopfia rhizophila CBS 207.26]